MLQKIFSLIGLGLILIFTQATIFNHIHLLGYATPLPYVYLLLKLPSNTPRTIFLLVGFVLGMTIDVFSNTPGMTAASLCVIGLTTPWIFNAFAPKDRGEEVLHPSTSTMGAKPFYLYAFTTTLIHCIIFLSIETFSFFNVQTLLLKILGSTVLTFGLIFVFENLHPRRSKTTM
jgi:rod shape-determining protein MreD